MDETNHHLNYYFIGDGLKWCHHDSLVLQIFYKGEKFHISTTGRNCEVGLKCFFFNKLLCKTGSRVGPPHALVVNIYSKDTHINIRVNILTPSYM